MHKEEIVREMLVAVGEDPFREGLKETPARVVKSWGKLYGGYLLDPADVLRTVFTDGHCDEMVVLRDIEFYSMCEHHMLPFFGKCHIGYLPSGCVVGLSKLARLVEVFARRLQIQEKLTAQIADAIQTHLQPKGAMVVMEAQHLCMLSRGVEKQESCMLTSAIRGSFKLPEVRSEFLRLIGK